MPDRVIFEESLIYLAEKRLASRLDRVPKAILTKKAIIWYANGDKHRLDLDDVVGVTITEGSDLDRVPCLSVNAYPLRQWGFSVKRRRILREYKFACPNIEVRSRWLQAINNTLHGLSVDANPEPLRLQILLNPISGKKQAREIFERVRPLFERSHLLFTITDTSSTEETRDFLQKIALKEIDILVIVGGDGTIHEAIDCLMSREDWQSAIAKPIGVIPAGTGNGLSKTLLEDSGEPYDPVSAAFLIAKGKKRPYDIIMSEQNGRRGYSFLSLSWGLVSDVDIESEKLRFLGSLRFDLYALLRVSFLRTYRGRFSFVPHPDGNYPLTKVTQQDQWQVIEDDFILFWAMNATWAAHDLKVAPHAKFSDGAMDVLLIRKGASRKQVLSAFLRCATGEHISLPYVEYYKVRRFHLEPLTQKGILVLDGEQLDYSPVRIEVIQGLARMIAA